MDIDATEVCPYTRINLWFLLYMQTFPICVVISTKITKGHCHSK